MGSIKAEVPVGGVDQANGVSDIFRQPQFEEPECPDGPYRVLNQYHSKPRKLRVACVGAGASGLCLAYKMEKMMEKGSWDLTLFEKNQLFGGTWVENTYPGVACDIPAPIYTYTWDPNPDWSQYFAAGKEIQGYFNRFAAKHKLERYIKSSTKVIEARWNEEKGIWELTLENQETKKLWKDYAHYFINGSGILNNWKWPDIPGLHDFKGSLIHSARWDHSIEIGSDSIVGVIGNGSTAVQIVPQMQKVAKKVFSFARSSTWISPPFGAGALEGLKKNADVEDVPGLRQYTFSAADKQKFKEDPAYFLQFRKGIEAEINGLFGMYRQGSELSDIFRNVITKEMNRRMGEGNEKLKSQIIPNWAPGCRRISPGDGYLEALVSPNVENVWNGIRKVIPEGIVTEDGRTHKMDVLICATGFQVAFKPAFKVINAAGVLLDDDWANGPNLYFGTSAPRFPNFSTIVGPGATWSNGTLLPSIETTIEHSIKLMKKIQSEGIKAMEVKQEVVDEIYAHFDEFHTETVWQENCRSWFKDGKIKNRIYLWPGSTIHFLKSLKDPRFEDYNYRYNYKNRFAYLGNGDVKYTASKNVLGLAPYIRDADTEWSVE